MISSAVLRLRDRRDSSGDSGDDAGFTLIELMVVLLILAILLAIAIPTFLGVTKSANDRAVQSNLNTALTNAKATYQTGGQVYGTAVTPATLAGAQANATTVVAALNSAEPSLQFTTNASTSQSQISVAVSSDGQAVILAAQAKSTGNCFYVVDSAASESGATGGIAPFVVLAGYTGSAMLSGTNVTAGTWYGESKSSGSPVTCNAAAPTAYNSNTTTFFQANGFPAL
jgi:type IV pilus assembly protein PilA